MSDYETMVCPECCSEEIYFDEDLFGGFGGYFCEDCDASWPILQDYQNSTDITTERDELKAIVEKLPLLGDGARAVLGETVHRGSFAHYRDPKVVSLEIVCISQTMIRLSDLDGPSIPEQWYSTKQAALLDTAEGETK